MPAIQVYKGAGKMIPVEDAKVAKAYQCPWTNDLFANKSSYLKHLRILRRDRMHQRARVNRWQRLGEDLWNQPTFEDIIRWIELHPEWFLDNKKRHGWSSDARKLEAVRPNFSIRIIGLKLHYSDKVSNSHSCPHNGVQNWCGRSDHRGYPSGYPGWSGYIKYQLSHDLPGFGSEITRGTRINTGTGGGRGNYSFEYDVKFFADDWPGITATYLETKRRYEAENLTKMLRNEYVKPFEHRFEYNAK